MPTRGFDGGEVNDSQIDLLSNADLSSPGAGRTGYYEGRMNSQADWGVHGITSRIHKQDSVSTSHRGSNHINDSFSYT
jgi:hemolysin activation/secretion protein